MPITQPNAYPVTTSGQEFAFGVEGVAYGTAAATINSEPVLSVDDSPQRETADDAGQAGAASDVHGIDEATHYEQFTVHLSARPNGFVAYQLAALQGPITATDATNPYTLTGAGTNVSPYLHGMPTHPTSNLINSYSCWYQASSEHGTVAPAATTTGVATVTYTTPGTLYVVGDTVYQTATNHVGTGFAATVTSVATGGIATLAIISPGTGFAVSDTITLNNPHGGTPAVVTVATLGASSTLTPMVKQMLAASPTSVHLTFTENAELAAEVAMWSFWPTNIFGMPAVNGAIIGSTAAGSATATAPDRLMSTRGTFTIVGSSGAVYTTRVLSGDVTLARTLEVCQPSDQRGPYYIKAGVIQFTGNLVIVFEGYGAGTVEEDFRAFKAGGKTTAPNILRFTTDPVGPAATSYIELVSYPWSLTAFSLDHSGQYIKANISFRAFNDPTKVYSTTPQLTKCVANIQNYVATRMTGP